MILFKKSILFVNNLLKCSQQTKKETTTKIIVYIKTNTNKCFHQQYP